MGELNGEEFNGGRIIGNQLTPTLAYRQLKLLKHTPQAFFVIHNTLVYNTLNNVFQYTKTFNFTVLKKRLRLESSTEYCLEPFDHVQQNYKNI